MQIRPEQLEASVSKKLNSLYILFGEEPLLVQESADYLRSFALTLGFCERLLFTLESPASFDWDAFTYSFTMGSLFSEKKIIELILHHTKFNDQGNELFKQIPLLLANNPNILFLIRAEQLSPAVQKSAWFSALTQHSHNHTIVIPHRLLNKNQLSNWIVRCTNQKYLKLEPAILQAILQQNEGNTLAASQEIAMLDFIYSTPGKMTSINLEQYQEIMSLTRQSRFTVFDLQDVLLQGDTQKTLKILSALNPSEFMLILWSVSKIVRVLISLDYQLNNQLNNQVSLPQALQALSIWSRSAPLYTMAIKRLSLTILNKTLQQLHKIDTDFKTGGAAQAWRDLIDLCLKMTTATR